MRAQTLLTSNLLRNVDIAGKGGVLASPDQHVPGGGTYVFHWYVGGKRLVSRALLSDVAGTGCATPR